MDDDGNQTLVTTKTGLWRVTYNGENRPVRWVRDSDGAVITMSYDHMGRRRTKNGRSFYYDGYLQIADSDGNRYVWDPTEPTATRPLAWMHGETISYYTHDGNKNVSEVITNDGTVAAHYEYAPFGATILQRGDSLSTNPWRFSSEYAEDDTATVYYNYRHYEPVMGRWMSRDPIEEVGGLNVYVFCDNDISAFDFIGFNGISDDLGAFCQILCPMSPEECRAEAERQAREKAETERVMPNLSITVGVSGTRSFPIGIGGISIKATVEWKFGTCCDKNEKRKRSYKKLTGSVLAIPYLGFRSPISLPEPDPPAIRVDLDKCPSPGDNYDGVLSFTMTVGGSFVECSYSFKDAKWSCGAGFELAKVTNVSISGGGGVVYEQITLY